MKEAARSAARRRVWRLALGGQLGSFISWKYSTTRTTAIIPNHRDREECLFGVRWNGMLAGSLEHVGSGQHPAERVVAVATSGESQGPISYINCRLFLARPPADFSC